MEPMSRLFAGTLATVAAARAFVGDYFEGEDRDNAVLALSEVATNAITHGGGGDYVVTVRSGGMATRVLVKGTRNAPTDLVANSAAYSNMNGRGLFLVNAYTSAWGTHVDSDGVMLVWFDIAHPRTYEAKAA